MLSRVPWGSTLTTMIKVSLVPSGKGFVLGVDNQWRRPCCDASVRFCRSPKAGWALRMVLSRRDVWGDGLCPEAAAAPSQSRGLELVLLVVHVLLAARTATCSNSSKPE